MFLVFPNYFSSKDIKYNENSFPILNSKWYYLVTPKNYNHKKTEKFKENYKTMLIDNCIYDLKHDITKYEGLVINEKTEPLYITKNEIIQAFAFSSSDLTKEE